MSKPHYPPRSDNPLLTSGQTARHLGVSLRTVQLWAADGKLRVCTTPGGHRRFRSSDVAAFAQEHGMHFAPGSKFQQQQTERDLLEAALRSLLAWCRKFDLSGQPVDHASEALQTLGTPAT